MGNLISSLENEVLFRESVESIDLINRSSRTVFLYSCQLKNISRQLHNRSGVDVVKLQQEFDFIIKKLFSECCLVYSSIDFLKEYNDGSNECFDIEK